MVHAQVLEAYINFALMYTAYHIFPVLPIKYLINEDFNPTMPFKLATGPKPDNTNLVVKYRGRHFSGVKDVVTNLWAYG